MKNLLICSIIILLMAVQLSAADDNSTKLNDSSTVNVIIRTSGDNNQHYQKDYKQRCICNSIDPSFIIFIFNTSYDKFIILSQNQYDLKPHIRYDAHENKSKDNQN